MNSKRTHHPVTRHPAADRKPRVHCQDTIRNRHIVAALPQLHEAFIPTPWLFNTHAQLVFHGLRKKLSRQKRRAAALYDHHDHLTMRDGGRTALLWCGHALPPTTPTIVVLHTVTGSPASMAELVHDLHAATGWRIVLCLRRGHADLPLATPRLNILGCSDDLREQLRAISERFPASPLYGVGSSAGSGLLARYLGEEGEASLFHAAFAYCPGYDTDIGFDRAQPFYSRMMAKKLVRQFITPNLASIGHLPTAGSLQVAADLAAFHRNLYELADAPGQGAEHQILTTLAARVRRAAGFRCVVGLYHPRCFVVVLAADKLNQATLQALTRLRSTVAMPMSVMDTRQAYKTFKPELGMGVVTLEPEGSTPMEVINQAERRALAEVGEAIESRPVSQHDIDTAPGELM